MAFGFGVGVHWQWFGSDFQEHNPDSMYRIGIFIQMLRSCIIALSDNIASIFIAPKIASMRFVAARGCTHLRLGLAQRMPTNYAGKMMCLWVVQRTWRLRCHNAEWRYICFCFYSEFPNEWIDALFAIRPYHDNGVSWVHGIYAIKHVLCVSIIGLGLNLWLFRIGLDIVNLLGSNMAKTKIFMRTK